MGGVDDVGAEDVVMDGDEVDDAGAEDVGEEDEGEEKKGAPAPKYKYVVDSCSSFWMTDAFLRPRTPPCVACANAGLECEYCPPLSFHKAEVWCCRWCQECSRRKCLLQGLGVPLGPRRTSPSGLLSGKRGRGKERWRGRDQLLVGQRRRQRGLLQAVQGRKKRRRRNQCGRDHATP